MKESDVGDIVKSYLIDMKQDVYCEVEAAGGRVDIVAVCGRIVTAVELKTCLSLDLLGQAIDRRRYVHRSIAVAPSPKTKYHKTHVIKALCAQTGIGVWLITSPAATVSLY